MNEETYYANLYEGTPQYPLAVLEFLKTELQLGKRYVVMDIHTHNGQLSKLLHKHVHLVCSLSSDPGYHNYLKNELSTAPNFLSLNGIPELTNIEEDSIDCLCIDETFDRFDVLRMSIEFERILRLNSYVLILRNHLDPVDDSFTQAYRNFVETSPSNEATKSAAPSDELLKKFYTNGFALNIFKNQQRFDWAMLEQYYLTNLEKENQLPNAERLNDLKALFNAYQQEGEVTLEYQTHLHYGLFNHSVPEISLRKSIFFNVLRPFAFGFYVLVKTNIYFWKALYKIKNKLFSNSPSN